MPISIASLVENLGQLEVVLGSHVRPVLESVRHSLVEAMAARDRGEGNAALAKIGDAMDKLAGLADGLDPAEAALMRAVTQGFRTALSRGDTADAHKSADVMFDRSGAKPIKKS